MTGNTKAVVRGIGTAVVVFVAIFIIGAFHHRSSPPQAGSVAVRPIQNQDGGTRLMFALVVGVAAGFGAHWYTRRSGAKSDS
ncbi:MAG: hypothetical protein FWD68_20330 [Alphaproteobacteria bacterium]|nr:hypothetical protein [Alphaproteobacteria bacterium]